MKKTLFILDWVKMKKCFLKMTSVVAGIVFIMQMYIQV